MKWQGRNWLKQGAENMTTLLTALRNKDFKERYRDSHPDMVFSPAIQVSLRKILKRSKHEVHIVPPAIITLNGATSSPIGQLKKWI